MSNSNALKRIVFPILKSFQVDRLFQYLNREKVLILAYHGITRKKYKTPPWILITEESFEKQIKYVSRRYKVIPLEQAVNAFVSDGHLPKNTAVITFDDGYRNNYKFALPVLQKYKVPATIFMTAGYIGTDDILPMDEAYLVVAHSGNRSPLAFPEIGLGSLYFDTDEAILGSYNRTVSFLKKYPASEQKKYLKILKDALGSEYEHMDVREDFLLLSWEEIGELVSTGLVQVGAHTLSHQILSSVSFEEAEKEIIDSKYTLQKHIGHEITLFAYPNGAPEDYNIEHIRLLKENGFICSVTTTAKLNQPDDDPYQLGRICIGPELSNSLSHFALKVAGFTFAMKPNGNHEYV